MNKTILSRLCKFKSNWNSLSECRGSLLHRSQNFSTSQCHKDDNNQTGGFEPPFGLEFSDNYFATNYGLLSDVVKISESPPQSAKVVICGGGMVGTALLYNLAKLGMAKDVVLLEMGSLGSESSWHGSGFLGGVKLSKAEMRIQCNTLSLVQELASEGHDTGWKQTGSLHLAKTKQRITHFRKMMAIAQARGTECELLNTQQIHEKCAHIRTNDLRGAMWVPNDGVCHPYKLTKTLLKLANEMGAQIVENCEVKRVLVKEGTVVAAETNRGIIECDIFVNAAGTWARYLGLRTDPPVRVPIHCAQHYSLETFSLDKDNLENLEMPAIRDPDSNIYMREYDGAVLAGTFEHRSIPVDVKKDRTLQISDSFIRSDTPDWDHFQPALASMINRFPGMSKAILRKLKATPSGYSPDGKWITGMSPEVDNYYIAAGLKNGGSNAAFGLTEMLAKWIKEGIPPLDAYELEVARFLPAHNNNKFLRDRVTEVPGLHYDISFPFPDYNTSRCLRMSPVFPRMVEQGAHFGQVMGYERPCYFKKEEYQEGEEAPFIPSINKNFSLPVWFSATQQEYAACRETCGLLDYSSFTKFDIYSQDESVVQWLQYICSNDVDVPVGGIIHTGLQNPWGGYENDCSLARTAPNHYMMIAPTIQQTRCNAWLRRHLPKDGSVITSDVTSMYTALCIMGPKAKQVLSAVTDFDLSNKSFPFFSYREIDIGYANGIRAMNLTHTGELGWVLYIPNEFAFHVYESLVKAGEPLGLRHAGYYAMRSLRIERFYAFWGQDLDSTTTPYECGRIFRVKLDKDIDFIGREALLQKRDQGVKRLYVQLVLDDHDHRVDAWPWGGEPIYRNGQFVGVTTTTGYGYTLQNLVCLGFIRHYDADGNMLPVEPKYVLDGVYEVDIAGIKYPASVSLRSPTLPAPSSELHPHDRYLATQTSV